MVIYNYAKSYQTDMKSVERKNDSQIRGLRAGISFAEKKIIINQRKMRIYT